MISLYPYTHNIPHTHTHLPILGVLCAWVNGSDYNEHMLELRTDILWCEWLSAWLLEDYGDNIIAYVPLPQQLLYTQTQK